LISPAKWADLIIIFGVGIVGFFACWGWSKTVGGGFDRDQVIFFAKLWGGIAGAFVVLALIA